jgi:hypothetical protein
LIKDLLDSVYPEDKEQPDVLRKYAFPKIECSQENVPDEIAFKII